MLARIVIHISIFPLDCTLIGVIIPLIPRIAKILNILLHTTFPIAISLCFLKAATMEVASSGRLVPMATTVNPITASDSHRFFASSTAPSTINFHPSTSHTSPIMVKLIDFNKLIFAILSSSAVFTSLIFEIPKT